MADSVPAGTTGTDGYVPLKEPDNSPWKIWALHEIYIGTVGEGRYVPKVKDYVVDIETNQYYKVASLDPTTLVPQLVSVKTAAIDEFTELDRLLGPSPNSQSETYLVYIDKSVIPYKLSVDRRLKVQGTDSLTCKLYIGSELTSNEKVISAVYDSSGNVTSQSIELQLSVMANGQNVATRFVPDCYTTEDLADGEIVTAVFYSGDDFVVSKRQLFVENTAFISDSDTGLKYVVGISLKSPFLSQSDPQLIQYPINVPQRGLNLFGIVNYSDGSKIQLPVDGTKFQMLGLTDYAATIVGQKFPLQLKYNLSSDEVCFGANVGNGKFITESFTAITIGNDGAYSCKLFGYPVWIDAANGYRLEWFLYNLDRNSYYLVTPYVRINTTVSSFNPTAYGYNQKLSVSVDLHDVDGIFKSFIHTQVINITLIAQGTERTTNWTVGFDPNQNPQYGLNNAAKTTFVNQNLTYLDISLGETVLSNWLARIWEPTKPLFDPMVESTPPTPDYFAIIVNGVATEFPISQWSATLTIGQNIPNNSTVFVKFFKRTPDNDLQISISGLPVYQQN